MECTKKYEKIDVCFLLFLHVAQTVLYNFQMITLSFVKNDCE